MIPRFVQGTSNLRFRRLGVLWESADHVVRDDQPEPCAHDDRGQRHERGLKQEAELHHAPAEPDRAEHPDLLLPLDDGPARDHAQRGHADYQAETHEALDDGAAGLERHQELRLSPLPSTPYA
jgi:hypothetical protein